MVKLLQSYKDVKYLKHGMWLLLFISLQKWCLIAKVRIIISSVARIMYIALYFVTNSGTFFVFAVCKMWSIMVYCSVYYYVLIDTSVSPLSYNNNYTICIGLWWRRARWTSSQSCTRSASLFWWRSPIWCVWIEHTHMDQKENYGGVSY